MIVRSSLVHDPVGRTIKSCALCNFAVGVICRAQQVVDDRSRAGEAKVGPYLETPQIREGGLHAEDGVLDRQER